MTGFPSNISMSRLATIETPIETLSQYDSYSYCLSFWSFISQDDAVLSIDLGLYSLTAHEIDAFYTLNTTETKWTPHYVDIPPTKLSKYLELNFYITALTKDPNTIVAIDDIELNENKCSYRSKFRCTDDQIVDMSKRCDFRKDCSDGLDEFNCGTCNFENGR